MTTLHANSEFNRVLIIDDEPSVLFALKLLLEALGFTVKDFASAFEAAQHLRHETGYDVILCDLRMPEMDGISLLEHIRKLLPDVPFILISGHAQVEEIERATALGASGFLDKPFTPDQLGSMLDRISARKER